MIRAESRGVRAGRGIREEGDPLDLAAGRGLDSLGQGYGWGVPAVKNFGKVGTMNAQLTREFQDHAVGKNSRRHGSSIVCDTTLSSIHAMDALSFRRQHPWMDVWPQRTRFKNLILSYRTAHAIDRASMAEMLGIKESHLHGLLYDRRVRPGLEVVQRAAEVFEISITELVDDPGSAPPGVDPKKWGELTEKKRVLASAMLEDLAAIPDGEEDVYYALWKQGQDIGRARRAQEAKTTKKPASR